MDFSIFVLDTMPEMRFMVLNTDYQWISSDDPLRPFATGNNTTQQGTKAGIFNSSDVFYRSTADPSNTFHHTGSQTSQSSQFSNSQKDNILHFLSCCK